MLLPWILGFSVLSSLGAIAGAAAARAVTGTVLAGIVLFFVLEKLVLWRHCHERDCVAHEVPQEVGDFGILLDNRYSRGRSLLLNTLSSAATLPGAVLAYFWQDEISQAVPFILALSAARFIY